MRRVSVCLYRDVVNISERQRRDLAKIVSERSKKVKLLKEKYEKELKEINDKAKKEVEDKLSPDQIKAFDSIVAGR